jgi:hypothetical protein
MKNIISALFLYDLNKDIVDTYLGMELSNVDLTLPVIIDKAGIVKNNIEPLIKVLQSKDLINVYYQLEEENEQINRT